MSSTVPALYIWRDHLDAWRPLLIGATPRGRQLVPAFRDQLASVGYTVDTVDLEFDDQELIDEVQRLLPVPLSPSFAGSFSGEARSSDASASVPVIYVWSDLNGAWSPLLVAKTATGRRLAPDLFALLGDLGVPVWLHGVPQDDDAAIFAAARSLRTPAGAGFIDFAPDGVIDYDVLGLSAPPN